MHEVIIRPTAKEIKVEDVQKDIIMLGANNEQIQYTRDQLFAEILKEQQTIIEDLKSRIETLEG